MDNFATEYVKAINPSLTEYPRPIDNKTGDVICYLGADGSADLDKVIYCKDLPIDMVGSVGSWYITPQRHFIEWILVSLVSVSILFRMFPKLGTACADKRPPSLIRFISFAALVLQSCYKILGYKGKILSMLLPCNLLWFFAIILSFFPTSSAFRAPLSETIIQLWFSYIGLPLVALSTPDTKDSIQLGEFQFFFIHHSLLALYPLYYLFTNRTSTLHYTLLENIQWVVVSGAFFGLFYFGLMTPLGLYVGLNLNYMLSPPDAGFEGPTYRLWSIVLCQTLFAIMRALIICGEILLRGRSKPKIT